MTSALFAQLDDRFGGEHARHSLIQYLSREITPMLADRYTGAVGRQLFGAAAVATPAFRAQFHAMEARAHTRTGDVRTCELALAASRKALDRRDSADEPEWITYFDEVGLAAEAAHRFRDVNSARQAVAHAENTMSGRHVRSDFFATMVLADARLRAGEPEEACRVALEALDLGEQLKSASCVRYAAEFRQHLATVHDVPAIRDFHGQAAEHRLWTLGAGCRVPPTDIQTP